MQEKLEAKQVAWYSAPAADENCAAGFTWFRLDASNFSCIFVLRSLCKYVNFALNSTKTGEQPDVSPCRLDADHQR